MLIDSIIYSQDERLISLAGELAGEQERSWLGPALAADFLTKPAAFVYESYCRKIPRDSLLGKEDKRKTRTAVLAVLGRIHCIREDGECEILCRVDEKSGTAHRIGRRLYEKPDSRWMDMLMDAGYLEMTQPRDWTQQADNGKLTGTKSCSPCCRQRKGLRRDPIFIRGPDRDG